MNLATTLILAVSVLDLDFAGRPTSPFSTSLRGLGSRVTPPTRIAHDAGSRVTPVWDRRALYIWMKLGFLTVVLGLVVQASLLEGLHLAVMIVQRIVIILC